MMQKSLQLPNSMRPTCCGVSMRLEQRAGKALRTFSFILHCQERIRLKTIGTLPLSTALSLMTLIGANLNPSPPLPDPMHDEHGEFRGRVLINQHEWQVHCFDALDKKTGRDDDRFRDALEQFEDDPDSVIDLVVCR